jgi:hypothetical protein
MRQWISLENTPEINRLVNDLERTALGREAPELFPVAPNRARQPPALNVAAKLVPTVCNPATVGDHGEIDCQQQSLAQCGDPMRPALCSFVATAEPIHFAS